MHSLMSGVLFYGLYYDNNYVKLVPHVALMLSLLVCIYYLRQFVYINA
jgi:hypothetical protein